MSRSKQIIVNDKMQRGYRYFLTAPTGRNFASDFRPQLTPRQMLTLGVFGGKYLTDCRAEFPASWFQRARLSPEKPNWDRNFFKVRASQSLAVWREKGWINAQDPRGWFQWYCRYYLGRRSDDDARQVRRWLAMRRHLAQLKKNCRAGDWFCRRRQRQALLQWAYDTRLV